MPIFMQIEGIEGEISESEHVGWIEVTSLNSPIYRSIAEGTLGANRNRGTTSLGDLSITRTLDKSSVKLQQACADGTYFPTVTIHFASSIAGQERVFHEYILKNCIVTGYNFTCVAEGDSVPAEDVTLNFTAVDWKYIILNPDTGDVDGNVPGTYVPAEQ